MPEMRRPDAKEATRLRERRGLADASPDADVGDGGGEPDALGAVGGVMRRVREARILRGDVGGAGPVWSARALAARKLAFWRGPEVCRRRAFC